MDLRAVRRAVPPSLRLPEAHHARYQLGWAEPGRHRGRLVLVLLQARFPARSTRGCAGWPTTRPRGWRVARARGRTRRCCGAWRAATWCSVFDGTPVERFRDVDLRKVGLAVTRLIERRYGGDRRAAVDALTRRVARVLGVRASRRSGRGSRRSSPSSRTWRAGAAPTSAASPRWYSRRRASARGPYVLAMLRHGRFRKFLESRFALVAQ